MTFNDARTRRNPGPVPKANPPELTYPLTRADVDALNRYLREDVPALDKFILKLTHSQYGLPAPHGRTHKKVAGQTDSISGSGEPEPVGFSTTGAAGDPTQGYAPFTHIHPAADGLASLEGLSGVTTDAQYGAHVEDIKVRRLLEEIVLLAKEILGAVE